MKHFGILGLLLLAVFAGLSVLATFSFTTAIGQKNTGLPRGQQLIRHRRTVLGHSQIPISDGQRIHDGQTTDTTENLDGSHQAIL